MLETSSGFGAIVEARMNSSRLPGKVMMDIGGQPAIGHLLDRLSACEYLNNIVVATSDSRPDDPLVDYLNSRRISSFRGSEEDVLDRVVQAADFYNVKNIVSLTADCIFTDTSLIDFAVAMMLSNPQIDFLTNCAEPLTWPMGQYFQVCRKSDLSHIAETVNDPAVREHVTLHYYDNPGMYNFVSVPAPKFYNHPTWRLQLDYEEDLIFLKVVYEHLHPVFGDKFGINEIVKLLISKPELLEINKNCVEKSAR